MSILGKLLNHRRSKNFKEYARHWVKKNHHALGPQKGLCGVKWIELPAHPDGQWHRCKLKGRHAKHICDCGLTYTPCLSTRAEVTGSQIDLGHICEAEAGHEGCHVSNYSMEHVTWRDE